MWIDLETENVRVHAEWLSEQDSHRKLSNFQQIMEWALNPKYLNKKFLQYYKKKYLHLFFFKTRNLTWLLQQMITWCDLDESNLT